MMTAQMQRLFCVGKRVVIVQKCFYSSDIKNGNGHVGDRPGSVHLPNNVEEIDAGQKALFSPERTRDISGPNIDSHFQGSSIKSDKEQHQAGEDAHVGAYACSGSGIHLNSVMQPNVPLPFDSTSENHRNSSQVGVGDHSSYVDISPEGGHWTGGDKYLAEDRKNVHARGDKYGGMGNKPGTTPLGIDYHKSGAVLGYLPMACGGFVSPYFKQIFNWQNGNMLASHQTFGYSPFLPPGSTSCLTYSTSTNSDNINVAPLSRKDKLKKAVKDYGATVIVFHVGISLLSLGGFYLAVSSGLDVMDILQKLGVSGKTVAKEASTFALAYIVHKAFAPVRISITLAATPFIVRYLRRVGILKAPK